MQALGTHLIQAHLLLQHTGIVHQCGDRPKLLTGLLKQAQNIGLFGDIGLQGQGLGITLLQAIEYALGGFLILPIADGHGIALLSGQISGGFTNTAAAAGNENDGRHRKISGRGPKNRSPKKWV